MQLTVLDWLTRFTAPFNLTGLPALSVPCGWSGEKMPIGLQIVGKPWADSKVLGVGALYEQWRGFPDSNRLTPLIHAMRSIV